VAVVTGAETPGTTLDAGSRVVHQDGTIPVTHSPSRETGVRVPAEGRTRPPDQGQLRFQINRVTLPELEKLTHWEGHGRGQH